MRILLNILIVVAIAFLFSCKQRRCYTCTNYVTVIDEEVCQEKGESNNKFEKRIAGIESLGFDCSEE
jgi:hypothetical protein